MYMNLKAKCFTHLEGRTCQKPGHSCLRKVVSWCSHPAVDYYRWLARGVQTLVAAWGKGHDVTSLKTAAAELRDKVAALTVWPLTTSRGQRGGPLARSSVPGAMPTCSVLPWSLPTRPRCMRRSPRAESGVARNPSSPGPRTAATRG